MIIAKSDGHSFTSEILTAGGWVLDIGCRGFVFAKDMVNRGMKVICFDPDKDIVDPCIDGITYENAAVTCSGISESPYAHYSYGEGNYLTTENDKTFDTYIVKCTDIGSVMAKYSIKQFDLIKMDCEGSEYLILESLPSNCAKQITVEFHDFLGRNPCPDNEKYYTELKSKLKEYTFVKHERTSLSETNGTMNYWDSLIVHNDYCRE